MSNVIGTIISVNEFLNSNEVNIYMRDKKGEDCEVFTLKGERKYVVPSYQRELRWDEKQIYELIYDVVNGKQFLGNIIVSESKVDSNTEYEVIDGQQRITSLRMVVKYIFETHGNPSALERYELCDLVIRSFADYVHLDGKSYQVTQEEKNVFGKTDDYHQMDNYIKLWSIICNCDLLKSNEQKRNFLTKLNECNLNLIIVDRKHIRLGIEYFVDVNQKGVKLDPEDTLKGYLFQYNSAEMKDLWADIKKICFAITEDYKCKYSLLLLFEQYFYCALYKDEKFKNISLKQDFSLKEDLIIKNESGQKEVHFSKGTHLVQALRDHRDVLNDVKCIREIAKVILHIVKEPNITSEFRENINPQLLLGDSKFSPSELECIYHMLRQIMLDTNEVPKALVVKYISDILLNKSALEADPKTKPEKKLLKQTYQSVYTMYILYILFALFVGKKQKDRIYNVFKDGDYGQLMTKAITSILSENKLVDNQKSIGYKTFTKSSNEDPRKDAYRCKAVATLYNYMYFDTNKNIYTFNNHGDLATFLNDTDKFSLEHFLLNSQLKSRIYLSDPENTVPYCNNLLRFVGSMFNFLFINEKVNNTILDNRCLWAKVEILNHDGAAFDSLTASQKELVQSVNIECEYSQMALALIIEQKSFGKYIEACKKQDEAALDQYFKAEFELEYSNYVDLLVEQFLERITYKPKSK